MYWNFNNGTSLYHSNCTVVLYLRFENPNCTIVCGTIIVLSCTHRSLEIHRQNHRQTPDSWKLVITQCLKDCSFSWLDGFCAPICPRHHAWDHAGVRNRISFWKHFPESMCLGVMMRCYEFKLLISKVWWKWKFGIG